MRRRGQVFHMQCATSKVGEFPLGQITTSAAFSTNLEKQPDVDKNKINHQLNWIRKDRLEPIWGNNAKEENEKSWQFKSISSRSTIEKPVRHSVKAVSPVETIQKKVRFQSNESTTIEAHGLDHIPLATHDIASLWWTREELSVMKRMAKISAVRFLLASKMYSVAAEELLEECRREQNLQKQSCHRDRFHSFRFKEALRIAVNHDARGLERTMISSIPSDGCQYYRHARKHSIKRVLETQALIKSIPCFCSVEERSNLLAAEIRPFSTVASQLACILAEGDANVVQCLYNNMDVPSATTSTDASTMTLPVALFRALSMNNRCVL